MPRHDSRGLDNLHGLSPARPQARQEDPEPAVEPAQLRPLRSLALQHGQLMPQGEDLRFEFRARPQGRA